MLQPPRLHRALRATNRALRPFARRFPALSLREGSICEAAQGLSGVEAPGDENFRPGLRALLQSLEEEAQLTPVGRFIARRMLVESLANRMKVDDWHRRHPEIGEQSVPRPLIVMGMGRTGTSILHDLLAQDPNNRVPLTWEIEAPTPPPRRSTYASDPRIQNSQARAAGMEKLLPGFQRMHPTGPLLPQECVAIFAYEFVSMQYQITFRVPSYGHWLHESADLRNAYRVHRRTLQLLQWHCPGRWVLKSPGHLWHLETLLDAYPDAILVHTHRDPLRVLSSLTSLGSTLRAMTSEHWDPKEVAREWSHWNAVAFQTALRVRKSGRIPPERILDIHFQEFLREPIETLRRVYDHAGLDFEPQVEEAMRAHLASHPADLHGRHAYSFSDTGLDPEEEREKVRAYQSFFDVADEKLS